MTDLSSEDYDALAGEHALGVLTGADLAQARVLMASDPSFRAAVTRWWEQLAPLLDEIPATAPPPSVWQKIARATEVVANDAAVPQLRRKLRTWRAFAAGATALAASLALVLVSRSPSAPPPRQAAAFAANPMIARLAGDGGVAMVATWDPDRGQLMVAAAAGLSPRPGHSHELWIIPAGGKPRSLGVMPAADAAMIHLPRDDARLMQAGGTVAITVEPLGGSPHGSPTGPIVASGLLKTA